MKLLTLFCLVILAMLTIILVHPSVRSSAERSPADASLAGREVVNTPVSSLEITDYSVEFPQTNSSQGK